MSANSRSIGQRLDRAKAPGLRAEVAQDWARNWMQDQAQIVALLDRAIQTRDWQGVAIAAAQLRAVTDKRFAALPGVIAKIAEAP